MQVRQVNLAEIGAAGAVVDTPSTEEFLVEIHKRASRADLDAIVAALERKSAAFASWLAPEALRDPEGVALRSALARVFATRRRVANVLGLRTAPAVGALVEDLLRGPDPLADRFDRFCAALDLPGGIAPELAAELLHFGDPARYWLWTRWMWNPATRTGALPLVVDDDFDLEAGGAGATYVRVGEAVRFLDETPEVASFRPAGSGAAAGALAADVFLVGVYSVYMSTVLGLKLSNEFNAVIPALPELARRLLGVHDPKEAG